MKKRFFIPVLTGMFLIFINGCTDFQRPIHHASPMVRVLLHRGGEIVIRPHDSFIFSANTRSEIGRGNVNIRIADGAMVVNGVSTHIDQIEIAPSEYFLFNGKRYRGIARVINTGNDLMLVNVLDIESYLYGVLPMEVPALWENDALKAQAVASRTYAIYEIVRARALNRGFDLYADTRSQVYGGMDAETKFTTAAVNNTMGEVIKYEGKIIKAYYHSCAGGLTESSEAMFGETRPYLMPVNSSFGRIYESYNWEIGILLSEFKSKAGGLIPGEIVAINVIERSPSQRISRLEITDSLGNKIPMSGNDFRMIVGATIMKSTRANIRLSEDKITVQGVGYGHGVGMGQWDAQGMAVSGYRYNDILGYFYRGTRVSRMW
jgi:stage II sporulation protein D